MHNGDGLPAAHATRPRRRRRALILIGALVIVALVLAAIEVTRRTLAEQEDARTDPAFYALPTPCPATILARSSASHRSKALPSAPARGV